jgi:hypothetical protein
LHKINTTVEMKIQPSAPITIEDLEKLLDSELPHYKIDHKKALMGKDYVQVSKSSFIGAWVKLKKDNTIVVDGVIPSVWVRGLLGGLLINAMTFSKRKKMETEIGDMLSAKLVK